MSTVIRQTSPDVVDEGCGALLLARALGWDGALVTQASVASIAYQVLDLDDSARVVISGSLDPADVIFDTAQQDGSWPYADGYNFRWLIPATAFDKGNHTYRAEVTVMPAGTDDQPFAIDRWYLTEDRH